MSKLRFAVIGAGMIARVNAEALMKTGRAEIAGVFSRTQDKALALCGELGGNARVYPRFEDLLSDNGLDAAVICTPQDAHRTYFEDCCRAGLYVLVEKPLAIRYEDCLLMIRTAEACHTRAVVCHTQRYRSAVADTIALVRAGAVGEIVSIVDTLDLDFFTDERPRWHFDKRRVGHAILFTHGAHQADRVLTLLNRPADWIAGRLESADAFRPQAQAHGLDSGYHLLGAAGRASFVLSAGGYCGPTDSSLLIRGTLGTVRCHLNDTLVHAAGVYLSLRGKPEEKIPLSAPDSDSYVRQMHDLLDCLEGKPNHAPTLRHAAGVIRLLEAAADSDAQGSAPILLQSGETE